jgi:hypothetical protein
MKKYFWVLFTVLALVFNFACKARKEDEKPFIREYKVTDVWQGQVSEGFTLTKYILSPAVDEQIGFIRVSHPKDSDSLDRFQNVPVLVLPGFLPPNGYSFEKGEKVYFFAVNPSFPEAQYLNVTLGPGTGSLAPRLYVGILVPKRLAETKLKTGEWTLIN